jgi:acyl carrier protein
MNTTEEVKKLIVEHCGATIEDLKSETLIDEDLGCTGDDAWELMEAFQEIFDVNLEEFDFSLHFGPEAGYSVPDQFGYYPVSIKHLINVANEKKWIMPPRNEANYNSVKKNRKKSLIISLSIFFIVVIVLFTINENITSGC